LLIAHISDLHLNTFYNDENYLKVKSLIKHLSEQKIDHLVITGDLTDNASGKDLVLIRRLLKKYGFLKGERLSIVIGNHDIFGGVQKAEDIFLFPGKCKTINYDAKVWEFTSCFPEAFENCYYISPNNYYPYAKAVNDTLVIGLNSVAKYSKLNNPLGSNGDINVTQFNEVFDLLTSNADKFKHRLILVHHHFNKMKIKSKSSLGSLWQNIEKQTMKLRNKRRLFNLFKEFKVDMILHGHLHAMKEYYRKGIRFANAGAAIKNDKYDTLNVNYINIGKENIEVNTENIFCSLRQTKSYQEV